MTTLFFNRFCLFLFCKTGKVLKDLHTILGSARGSGMGPGLSVVGKVKEGLKVQKSITKVMGKGYESVEEVTVPIKNTELLNKLNTTPKGDWVKVYEAGIQDGIIKSKVIGSGLEAVFKEVYELLEEMEDKNGSTRSVGEGKNKPDLDKVTEQEVKRYWIPDQKKY